MQFSQPMIAGGYAAESLAATQFAPAVAGCKIYKSAAGVFNVLLDDDTLTAGQYVAVVTPVFTNPTKAIGPSVTPATGQFSVTCLDDAHAAIDCGLMVAVFPLPVTT